MHRKSPRLSSSSRKVCAIKHVVIKRKAKKQSFSKQHSTRRDSIYTHVSRHVKTQLKSQVDKAAAVAPDLTGMGYQEV